MPEPRNFEVLLTAAEAYPRLEQEFLNARNEIVAGFRIFDGWTTLQSDAARQYGDVWFDLIVATLMGTSRSAASRIGWVARQMTYITGPFLPVTHGLRAQRGMRKHVPRIARGSSCHTRLKRAARTLRLCRACPMKWPDHR